MNLGSEKDFLRYAAFVGVVAILCYLNTLGHGFVSDDTKLILDHPYTREVSKWPGILTSGHYAGGGGYRPVTTFSFALNYFVGGAKPFTYHLVNVLLYAGNCLLLFLLLNRLLRSQLPALVASLIFTIHPLHTEVVAWISGRAELLATGFFLVAWLLHLEAKNRARVLNWPRVISLVSFFLGALSKENALILPAALFLGDLLLTRARKHWTAAAVALRYWPYLAAVAVYFAFRWNAYFRPLLRIPAKIQFIDNPLAHAPVAERVLTALKVQGEYLWLLIFPHRLCADYSYNALPVVSNPFDPGVVATILLGLVLGGAALYSFVRRGQAWFGLAFYALAILPVSNLFFPLGTIKAERLLYLPSLGFCFVAGLAWARASAWLKRHPERLPFGRIALNVLLIILLAGGARKTWRRNRTWHDEDTFWTTAVMTRPNNIKAQFHYGALSLAAGHTGAAMDAFRQALRVDPNFDDAIINLSAALLDAGQHHEATRLMQDAVARNPGRAAFHANLGLAYLASGRSSEGVKELQQAVGLKANDAVFHFNLGLALSTTGRPEEALAQYRRAVELKPDYPEAWNGLGAVLLKTRRLEEARAALRQALALRPGYTEALYNMRLLGPER